jgi:hypothetical protein
MPLDGCTDLMHVKRGHVVYNRLSLFALRRRAACRPKPSVLEAIRFQGLMRYRGTRAGRNRVYHIPVINGNRPVCLLTENDRTRHQHRTQVLSSVLKSSPTNPCGAKVSPVASTPTLYVFNAAALTKPLAIEQLAADLSGFQVDIAIITETHFKKKHTDTMMVSGEYTLFRRDRCGRRGGGVAVYVSDRYNASEVHCEGDSKVFELLWVNARGADCNVTVGALYHPPTPSYQPAALLDYIEKTTEHIFKTNPSAVVVLAGDLNALTDQDITARTGLISIVGQPTRGSNYLDRIYTSEPYFSSTKIVTSTVKSDHKAIIAYSGEQKTAVRKDRTRRMYRKRTPNQHALFLQHVTGLDLHLDHTDNVQEDYDRLYSVLLGLLDRFYPERGITMTSSDPVYMTPVVKAQLRRKNKLMRAGRTEEASALASRIGKAIKRRCAAELRHVDGHVDAKDMWQQVKRITQRSSGHKSVPDGITAEMLNTHYAGVSTDKLYVPSKMKLTCSRPPSDLVTELEVFRILDRLHHTATGLDNVPAWFLRLGAPVFSRPIAQLFSRSLSTAVVPLQWKSAYILPIPKVTHPTTPSDFRPISITSVLSRALEKHVVRTYIYPSLLLPPTALTFSDQFAFRPTGSTTAALITLFHTITAMLHSNQFVRVIALDFSKAFDTVRHSTLLEKLALLDLPDEVYNWLKCFFDGHSHCTQYGDQMSGFADILASVIQGSGVGPASYVVDAADLLPLTQGNSLVKYADDTYLIIPSCNSATADSEVQHVESWAAKNNLNLNQAKSLEIVFVARGVRGKGAILPPPLPGITRVCKVTALGVIVNDRLSASDHVDSTITACAKSLYALKVLRNHGMPNNALQTVFRATTQAKLIYASQAWFGFCQAVDRDRLEAFLGRCKRFGYCAEDTVSVAELCACADQLLFRRVLTNSAHTLHHLLPAKTTHSYGLRPRMHDRQLPIKRSKLDTCNFLFRMLYACCH